MADLPKVRLEPTPPFTNIGCDCFGPFSIQEGRKVMKKYGVLFTCLASRAIHLEMIDDLSTDAFINALRCLIALRGPVRTVYCDQGTNFIGAANELKRNCEDTPENLKKHLAKEGCQFYFNTPGSSHMGGVWERQIRSVRNTLSGLLSGRNHKLDSSCLRTLFYEVAAIVNSRPLSAEVLSQANGPKPLTPNHLLTQKTDLPLPPPGRFDSSDEYSRKRWRRVQSIAEAFWKRWKHEYLTSLQPRSRWWEKKENMRVDDIVLVKDDNVVRNEWRLGRVTKVLLSDDGLVRRVELLIADANLDGHGKRHSKATIIQRPVTKLKLLLRGNVSTNR